MIFGNVTLERGNTVLRGYVMEDGSFQFLLHGKMESFDTLLDVWARWTAER